MLAIFKKKKSYGAYLKSKNGFEPLKDKIAKLSINDISSHLGYDSFHIHTFHNSYKKRSNIDIVAFEVFTNNVVFMLVKDKFKKPTDRALRKFLRNFKYSEEYDSIFIRDYLLEGIANKSLNIEFLSKVLNIPKDNPNAEILVKKLDVKLFFVNGYLASFKLTNDLEEWARHLKNINKDIIANYARLSKKYWIDDYEMIFNEVNIQSEAFANTPSGYKNEFINLHRGEFNTINFLMLLVCHYNQKLTEYQFQNCNHGRCVKVNNINSGNQIYEFGKFNYYFDKEGNLLKTEQKK